MVNKPTPHKEETNRLFESNKNNFQLIRFAAAMGVFLSHSFPLGGFGLGGKAQMLGHVSLNVFFIISGFLVCKSLFDRPLKHYLLSRSLRLFPALIIAVLFCTFGVGLVFTELPTTVYLTHSQVYEYAIKNSVLIWPETPLSLPGVFLQSPHTSTVNAPLWSLPYELGCYGLLAVLAWLLGAKRRPTLFTITSLTLFIVCFAVYSANQISRSDQFAVFLGKDTFRLTGLFFLGVSAFLLRAIIPFDHKTLVVLIGLFALSLVYRTLSIPIFYLLVGYGAFYFAQLNTGVLLNYNRVGDYSYGLYVFGYPIQQATEQLFPDLSLAAYIVVSFLITLLLAIASWHFIEARALAFKHSR